MALLDGHFTYPWVIFASHWIGNESDLFWISKTNESTCLFKDHTK